MKHQTKFTFLGLLLNSLVDNGKYLDLKETHEHLRNKTIFEWLKDQFDDSLDLSLYKSEELREIASFFEDLSVAVNETKKMGITNNGLCLLIAYCFEAIQRQD
jgi:hypothetical protein